MLLVQCFVVYNTFYGRPCNFRNGLMKLFSVLYLVDVRACVRACVRVCVRACVRACVRVCVCFVRIES